MPDRPDWQTLTATLPSILSVGGTKTTTTSIGAGQSDTVVVYAAPGTISRVAAIAMYTAGPLSGTNITGTHEMYLNTPQGVSVILGISNPTAPVEFNAGTWVNADNQQNPPAGANQDWWSGEIVCTETLGITMGYNNNSTGGTMTANRLWYWEFVQEDLP